MKFQWPYHLAWLILPISLLALNIRDNKRKRKAVERFVGPILVARFLPPGLARRRLVKQWLFIGVLLSISLGLAGPRFGKTLREVRRRGSDVLICVDVSASMLAEDVSPNRITKAKRELSALIEKLKGDRMGIVAFAGTAFLQCPLTTDSDAATMYLDLLDPASFPVPGTDIGAAIRLAARTLPPEGHSAIVFLTDGEDFGKDTPQAVKEAAAKGIKIFSIGFGTPQGELIRIRDASGQVTGFKKDENGQTVVSHLDEALLSDIARQTHGRYFPASNGDIEVDDLAQEISGMKKRDLGTEEISQLEHRFQIPLFIAFIFLILELLIPERPGFFPSPLRGGRSIFTLLLLSISVPALAGFREDINKGNKKYQKAQWEEALSAYRSAQAERPQSGIAAYNIGNVLYRTGRFEESLAELSRSTTTLTDQRIKAFAHYNRGNGYYRLGQSDLAIEEYKKALLLNPQDEDAKFNLEFTRRGPPQGQARRPTPNPQKNPEALSREDAERILGAIREQERQAFQSKSAPKPLPEQSPKGKDW